jgi:murein DD-endopeptidase
MIMLLVITMIACVGVPARARGNAYTELRSKLVHYARSMLGTPYVWGGTSPRGFDCSGLVQYSYEKVGVSVPRTAAEQLAASSPLGLSKLKPGDLLFFTTGRMQHHVGIYIGHGKFIHAPRAGEDVMISTLDNPYWHAALTRAGRFLN